MKKLSLFSALIMGAIVISCNKESDFDVSNGSGVNPTDAFAPLFSDYQGFFVATKSFGTQTTPSVPGFPSQEFTIEIGTAVAGFGNLQSGTFNDVGAVSLTLGTTPKKYDLAKQSNNAYVFTPSSTEPTGLPLSNSAGGTPFWDVPSLGISSSSPMSSFPSKPSMISTGPISKASDFTLMANNIYAADSVLYIIAAEGKMITKTIAGSASQSVTFTSSELSVFPTTKNAIMQISPYYIAQKTFGGKDYVFIHQTVVMKLTEITN